MRRLILLACFITLFTLTAAVHAQEATPAPEMINLNSTIGPCTPDQMNIMVPAVIQLNQLYRQAIAGSENLSGENVATYFTSMLDLRNQFRYRIQPQFPDCTLSLNHNLLFNALLDETLLSYGLVQMALDQRALGNTDLANLYSQMARNAGANVTQLSLLYQQFLVASFPTTSVELTPEATPEG